MRRSSLRIPTLRALANAPRNMTDEMIEALAKKGGVVQINFNCGFLSQRYRDEVAARSAETAAEAGDRRQESGRARNRSIGGQDHRRGRHQTRDRR